MERLKKGDFPTDPVVADAGLDYQPRYLRFIEETPVLRHLNRVSLFRFEDIAYVNRHPDVLGNGDAGTLHGGPDNPLIPLDIDGQDHTKYRRLLDPIFAPRSRVSRIADLEPVVRDLANNLIDTFIDEGQVEAYSAFCTPLPSQIFVNLLGLPVADMDKFLTFKNDLVAPQGATPEEMNANHDRAAAEMLGYLGDFVDERARLGPTDEDLVGGLMLAEVDGEALSRRELLNILYLLVLAGLDTVAATLSCSLMYLARNPKHRQELVSDPSMVPGAVEELLRTQSPVQQGVRRSTVDLTLPSGEQVKAGELIQCVWSAANLDGSVFPDPLVVDFRRSPNRHIAFASGVHRCLGSHLARLELTYALQEWHRRIPDYRLTSEADLRFRNYGVRTIHSLPLVFER